MNEKLVELRNEFVTEAIENASLQALVALVLAPATMAQKVGDEIKKRMSEGKCDCQEISKWIELFTSLGVAIADTHTKDFFCILHGGCYNFSLIDIKRFLLAFSIGRSCSDKVIKLFLQHKDINEGEILDVIDQLSPMSRKYFFWKHLSRGELSRLGYAHCLKYQQIGRKAIQYVDIDMSLLDEDEDLAELKKRLLAALINSEIRESVFNYMLTLKMLSREEVIELSEQDGMKQLAKRALKNNLQPLEED